ncbi:MAG: hypothetical protein WED11_12080, partial [Natronospirillum sp.]
VPVPPTVGKDFSPATVNPGVPSTLTITLTNTGSTASILSSSFTDTLPGGLVIAGSPSKTCVGGTLTAALGGSTVTLGAGASIPVGSCTITVLVSADAGGNYINSLAAGALVTDNGSNAAPAIATLTVSSPSGVSLSKAFSPATIFAGGTSTLTITLSNVGPTASLTAALLDRLPPGVVVVGNVSSTCIPPLTGFNRQQPATQPRFQTVAYRMPSRIVKAWFHTTPSTATLTGASIPANGSCTFTVKVTAPIAGSYLNVLPAGALQTTNGNNPAPAVATLTVLPVTGGPALSKSFSPSTIKPGGSSTLTITLTNSSQMTAKLIAPLTDYLPNGVVVYGYGSTTCSGGTVTAYKGKGSSKVILNKGYIPANGSCKVTVKVTAKYKGSYTNKLPVGALQTNVGSNTTAAVATLTVTFVSTSAAPKLSKAFSPDTIGAGGFSVVTITLTNPNSTVAKLTAPLTDYLPYGVVVYGYGSTTCSGGTVTAYKGKGSSKVILNKGYIPANGSCKVTVKVTAKYKGSYTNKLPVGALQTNVGSNTTAAVATLTVNKNSYW